MCQCYEKIYSKPLILSAGDVLIKLDLCMPLRQHFYSSEQSFAVDTKLHYINQSASIRSIVYILISFNAMYLVVLTQLQGAFIPIYSPYGRNHYNHILYRYQS